MDLEKVFTSKGNHWREQLIRKLLPCVKPDIDQKHLMNLIRVYVPAFSPTGLGYKEGGTWLFGGKKK